MLGSKDETINKNIVFVSGFCVFFWWDTRSLRCSNFKYFGSGFGSSVLDRNLRSYGYHCAGTPQNTSSSYRILTTVTTTKEPCLHRGVLPIGDGDWSGWGWSTVYLASSIIQYNSFCPFSLANDIEHWPLIDHTWMRGTYGRRSRICRDRSWNTRSPSSKIRECLSQMIWVLSAAWYWTWNICTYSPMFLVMVCTFIAVANSFTLWEFVNLPFLSRSSWFPLIASLAGDKIMWFTFGYQTASYNIFVQTCE